jgi:HPt (histidine-containing phosphotransfer) domain-containing protein
VSAQSQVFDLRAVQTYFLGNADMFAQARALFIRQTEASLAELAEAFDPAAFGRLVHRLQGSAATLGASQLAALCLRIEDDAALQQASSLAEVVAAFEAFVALSGTLPPTPPQP